MLAIEGIMCYCVYMKKIKLSRDKFLKRLQDEVGSYGREVVGDVYYSLERLITKELLANGTISLPDIGEFYLKEHAAREFNAVLGQKSERVFLPSAYRMKFKPDYKKRNYFNDVVKK